MEWHPKIRKYKDDLRGKELPKREAHDHPLKAFKVKDVKLNRVNELKTGQSIKNSVNNNEKSVKPKTISSWGGMDPLSAINYQNEAQEIFFNENFSKTTKSNQEVNSLYDDNFEHWNSKKSMILSKYTTVERLSIKASFLSDGNSSTGPVISVRNLQTTSVAEKVKHRLEQLDDFEEGSIKEMLNLTQQEYVNHIEELNCALHESWESDQRVKALRIAIQCAKLLTDVTVTQFYPSKFVLITDILDNFGGLVYKRIHSKVTSANIVDDSAKETCKNWFFKIASIRELIPRFYVETAILKTYGFLIEQNQQEYIKSLKRLNKMIRGIGDPLVAIYARVYLSRITIKIVSNAKLVLKEIFTDFLQSINQLTSPIVQSTLSIQKIDFSTYYSLYIPALDWILHCLAYKSTEIELNNIFEEFKQTSTKINNIGSSALVLNSILTCFSSNFVCSKAKEFVELVKGVFYVKTATKDNITKSEHFNNNFPTHYLIQNLGHSFNNNSTFWLGIKENEKIALLNDVWKMISKLKSTNDYMNCVEVWIEFVVKQFGNDEINAVLGDVIKHMLPDRAFEDHYNQLIFIINKIVSLNSENDFAAILSMNNFMPFLDLLQKETVKVEACKVIVENFVKQFHEIPQDESEDSLTTSDPVILNALTYLCKTMHDSVSALTLEDEKRQIGYLIISFLRCVSFKKDFEAQLNFYVESRGNFTNLDTVMSFLVHRVNTLAMETRRIVKGYHTKKTTAFVRACLAFSFITIPSLEDIILRLQLYLSSSHVALINGCLPQTDAFLKTAITLLPNVPRTIDSTDGNPKSTDQFLISYISEMLSFLVVVPDHPEQEPLYLLKGLLNVIQNYNFENSHDTKAIILMNILNLLSTISQESYPYHIDKVDSNDTLYGNDQDFISEINSLSNHIITEVLNLVKQFGDEKQFKRQASIALDLFHRVINYGDNKQMVKLIIRLWELIHKNGQLSTKQRDEILKFLRAKSEKNQDNFLSELTNKLENF